MFSAVSNFIHGKMSGTALRILMISVLMVPCFIKSSPAMDYLIGLKGGYFVWDPYLTRVGHPQFEEMENGSGVLYGPVCSLLFSPDISFSV